MSTKSERSHRDIELALGVELSALLSSSRALTERTAALFHPELQPAAFHLARWLYAYGPASPSVLAEAVAMDRSSTSNLIGQLRRVEYVESRPDAVDRRSVIISLTSTGRSQVLAALDLRGSTFFDRVEGWSREDLATFTALLQRFNTSG